MGVYVNVKANLNLGNRSQLFRDLKDGESIKFRFAPPIDGMVFVRTMMHYNVDKKAVPDLAEHGNDEYGFDSYISRLSAVLQEYGVNKHEVGVGRDIQSNPKQYAQGWEIIVRDGVERYTPRIFFSTTKRGLDAVIAAVERQLKAGEPLFNDPDQGQAVVISRSGEGANTQFTVERTGQVVALDKVVPNWKEVTKTSIKEISNELVRNLVSVDDQKRLAREAYPELDWERLESEFGL